MEPTEAASRNDVALRRQQSDVPEGYEGYITRYLDDGVPLVEGNPLAQYLHNQLGIALVQITAVPSIDPSLWRQVSTRVAAIGLRFPDVESANIKVTETNIFGDFEDKNGRIISSFAFKVYSDYRIGSGYASFSVNSSDFYAKEADGTSKNEDGARNILTRNQEAENGSDIRDGELDRVAFTALLDQVKTLLDKNPDLKDVFSSHAVNGGRTSVRPVDPVAEEIASTVTERWDERKEKHPREPWIKNPVKFVSHIYKRWLDAGTLKQIHLKHDPSLYRRYAEHISRNPDDDLGLAKSPPGPRSYWIESEPQ